MLTPTVMIFIIVLFVIVEVAVIFIVFTKKIKSLHTDIVNSWNSIASLIQQHNNKVINLISLCKQNANYNDEDLDVIKKNNKELLQALQQSDLESIAKSYVNLNLAIKELTISKEYSSATELQQKIASINDEILAQSYQYNNLVTTYNMRLKRGMYVLIAKIFNCKDLEELKLQAAENNTNYKNHILKTPHMTTYGSDFKKAVVMKDNTYWTSILYLTTLFLFLIAIIPKYEEFIYVIKAVLIIIAILGFYRGIVNLRTIKTFSHSYATAKKSTIKDYIFLKGQISKDNSPEISSPVSKTTCVWYSSITEQLVSNGKSSSYTQIMEKDSTATFAINSDENHYIIDPSKTVIITKETKWSGDKEFPDNPQPYSFFKVLPKNFKYTESILQQGDYVYAIGMRSQRDNLLYLSETNTPEKLACIISSKHPNTLASTHKKYLCLNIIITIISLVLAIHL